MADIIEEKKSEINKAQNEPQNTINNLIENDLPQKIEALKQESLSTFIGEDGKALKESDLTTEQRAELDEKMKKEIESLYEDAKTTVANKTKERKENLDKCKEDIQKFKEELESEVKSLEEKLSTLDPEKDADEYEKVNKEYTEKKSYLDRIPELEGKYKAAYSTQQVVVDQGILGLKKCFKDYSYINVDIDKDIVGDKENPEVKGILGDRELGTALEDEVKRDKEALEKIDPEKDPKKYERLKNKIARNEELLGFAPNRNKEEKNKEQVEESKEDRVANAAAQKGGASIPADVAKAMQQMAGQQVTASEETVEHKAPSYADILGYDSSNALNYDSSMNILGVFMGSADSPMGTPITDDLRIELLNSPEGAKIVQQALMKINSQDELVKYNFLNRLGKKFNSSRMNKKVMAMIEKQLPAQLKEKADSISKEDKAKIQEELGMPGLDLNGDIESKLKEMNADQINLLGNKVDSLSGVYNEKISELKEILNNKDLSDEDRTRYKGQLDVINSKKMVLDNSIGNYVGVHKFQDIAKDATKGEINQNYMLNPKSTISDDMPKKTFAGQDKVYSESQKIERDVKEQEIVDKYNDLRMSGKKIPTELQEQFNNISYKDLETIKNNRNEGPTKE